MGDLAPAQNLMQHAVEANTTDEQRRPKPARTKKRHQGDRHVSCPAPECLWKMIAYRVTQAPAPAPTLPPKRPPGRNHFDIGDPGAIISHPPASRLHSPRQVNVFCRGAF